MLVTQVAPLLRQYRIQAELWYKMVSKYYIDPGKHVRAQQALAQKIGHGCLHARESA